MMPTETEIQHFFEVYACRHFTRAAVKLNIAQPSLTQSIRRLEEKTKVALFHRTKQGCIPTEAAELFYARALQLQENWKSLSEDLNKGHSQLKGIFRIGCHPSVGAYTLPNFFKKLSKTGPQIDIKLHHDWSRNITEKLIRFELDLGFVINPVKHPDLVLRKLGEDKVRFWKAKGVDPDNVLFVATKLSQTRTLLTKTQTKKFADWKIIETPNMELIRSLVEQGAGVGILPTRVAQPEISNLVPFSNDLPHLHDEIYLVYRMNTLTGAAGKKIIECGRASL